MSTATNSDNLDVIASEIQSTSEKQEESGSDDVVHNAVSGVPEKKKAF